MAPDPLHAEQGFAEAQCNLGVIYNNIESIIDAYRTNGVKDATGIIDPAKSNDAIEVMDIADTVDHQTE
ncbi:hypothetical protein [Mariprofundus ferrooxydans]|uniref:hypothetical protein n=1 Tax=Mariprofundus ferrooxydans TaxID=314344 RepID=UPI00142FA65C|nr:hypothetical protein [Mariprofundus ferrooxydans]